MDIDGIYSVAALGIAGGSVIVLRFKNGTMNGNDSAGSRYAGKYSAIGGTIHLQLEVTSPPGTLGVFGTTPSETFSTRNDTLEIPFPFFRDRQPVVLPSYGVTVIATRIPDSYEGLSGPNGVRAWIEMLEKAEEAWKSRRD